MKNVVIIIPIYNPDRKFNILLQALKVQEEVNFDLLIVDSGSEFDTYKNDLDGLDYKIFKITHQEFNHGGSRQKAAELCGNYHFLVFMTQDAIPYNNKSICNLLNAFKDPSVGCAYGRQIPHKDASVLASRARIFNYPAKSRIKTRKDIDELGIKVSFISDTFAAYRREALDAVGGFPSDVILGEDTYVASKMILAGWSNSYCADAVVYHSHNYSVEQEFRRYFDTGVFHADEPWIQKTFGKAEGEGVKFVISELKFFLLNNPLIIPSMLLRDACKFIGYRVGKIHAFLPNFINRKFSMSKNYWK
ncbi:MAG: glycosyltransferase family 2 protein [Acidaminococcus sp.]|jgi:rhamnosyltransferase|nr:glycosyltransferase family 2 protein [Acidaminococcus sp.]MCI2116447.1 glycosyltransferase family 2 protein [Acidaminococcus sp.]